MQSHTTRLTALSLALTAALGCNRNNDSVGREAAQQATQHVTRASGMVDNLLDGLKTGLSHAETVVGAAMVAPVDAARVRNRLLDLGDDHNAVGRELSFFPTYFVIAVGPDGRAIAANRTVANDWSPGLNVGDAFACVGAALSGAAGTCAGTMPTRPGELVRNYAVAAVPLRAEAGGPVLGALVGAYSFGGLAKAVRVALDNETQRARVQLAVGIWNGTRVVPSGNDNDVQQMYLVPQALVAALPPDVGARVASGRPSTFTFSQNDGAMQWGGAIGQTPRLGAATGLIVYRAPLRQ